MSEYRPIGVPAHARTVRFPIGYVRGFVTALEWDTKFDSMTPVLSDKAAMDKFVGIVQDAAESANIKTMIIIHSADCMSGCTVWFWPAPGATLDDLIDAAATANTAATSSSKNMSVAEARNKVLAEAFNRRLRRDLGDLVDILTQSDEADASSAPSYPIFRFTYRGYCVNLRWFGVTDSDEFERHEAAWECYAWRDNQDVNVPYWSLLLTGVEVRDKLLLGLAHLRERDKALESGGE